MGAQAAMRQSRVRMPPTVASRPRSSGDGREERDSRNELDLIIAEFTSLRNEIDMRNTSSTQILNFVVLLVAGTSAAVFAAFNSSSFEKARPFVVFGLLVSSALFTALLYTFTEQEYETMFVASYVECRLRRRASQLVRREPDEVDEVLRILDWEAFRREPFRGLPGIAESALPPRLRHLVAFPSYYGRSLLILIPSVLCVLFSVVIFFVGSTRGWIYSAGFGLFLFFDLLYATAAFIFAHNTRHAHGHRIQPPAYGRGSAS